MSRREAWLSAGAVFLAALAVRAAAAAAISYPVPEDTAYYVAVARNLVEGHGLISQALWSYQTPPLVVPRAAFEVWLPLPTFLAALPMALFGPTFRAAQVAAVLVGALVPVLAWRLAADVAEERGLPAGRARTLAAGTGLVAAVYGPLVVHGALPDSTTPFTVLALAACLLMARTLRDPLGTGDERTQEAEAAGGDEAHETAGMDAAAGAHPDGGQGFHTRAGTIRDGRLVALGVVLGLAALARNEALWVALTWALLAWFGTGAAPASAAAGTGAQERSESARRGSALDRQARVRLIAIPALISIAIYLPWMLRDWLAFGSPVPGQTLANALSVTGFDIFAWQDKPTLARYLAQGWGAILGARVTGFAHNLMDVLLVPAIPAGPIGLVALPWAGRGRALRPLLLLSIITFTATTLFFPVATTWGTFLHAAGPVQVLLVVACLLALDGLLARVGRWRGWTRPVAWLGPLLVAATAIPVLAISIAAIAGVGRDAQARYTALTERLTAAGLPPASAAPIIADFPIWTAWSMQVPTLGLPDESPGSVLDLARHFHAHLLVVTDTHGIWPGVLADGSPDSACFVPIGLGGAGTAAAPGSAGTSDPLAGTRAYRIACGP
ncbi:MAG: hypothetical protein ACP5VP_06460 [Candidatus Limnocylindrales bacterium]